MGAKKKQNALVSVRAAVNAVQARLDDGPSDPGDWLAILTTLREAAGYAERERWRLIAASKEGLAKRGIS